MNIAEAHTTTQPSTWQAYTNAWRSLFSNWKVLPLIYAGNLLIAFIAMGPLSNVVKKAIEKTTYHDGFSSGFDYTLLMDILNNYGVGVNVSMTLLVSMAIPVFLWAVFCSGGITGLIHKATPSSSFSDFWQGGAKYFFRYLRLGIYVLGILSALLFLLLTFFFSDGMHVFALESEAPARSKFFLCMIILGIICFIMGIFKELAKARIAHHNSAIISQPNSLAFLRTFRFTSIFLGLTNICVLLLLLGLYYLLRKLCGGYLVPAVIIGQLFLIYRIAHRYVKQASFYFLTAHDVSTASEGE